MNKGSLATILGVALLGLAKKGSGAKIPLDDYFKKKVGNKDQTFKIYLSVYYPAIVKDDVPGGSEIQILLNFREEIEDYIRYIKGIVEGFRSFLESGIVGTTNGEEYWYWEDGNPQEDEEIPLHEIDDVFDFWVSNEDIEFNEWDDQIPTDRYFSDWERDYLLLSNLKFHFSFPQDTSDYKIRDEIREDNIEEVRSWISAGDRIEDFAEDWTTDVFVEKLYEEGSIGRYEWENDGDYFDDENFIELLPEIFWNARSDLLDLLDNWGWDLYLPDDAMIYWEEYLNVHLEIVAECRLDLKTMNIGLNEWHRFIHSIISSAYELFSCKNDKRVRTIELNKIPVLKVEPNIWEKKKSSSILRRR